MIPGVLPIALGMLIVIVGILVIGMLMRRYRRRLGIGEEQKEKTGNVAFVISAFHDVTRQLKEKEAELRRLKALAEQRAETVESYTENILQCVTNGVITFDATGIATTVNRAAAELLGIAPAEAVGRNCREIFGDGEICAAIERTQATRRPAVRLESALDRPAGRLWLGYNTAVLSDRAGESIGVIVSFSDLTEVKRLQEQVELQERLTALGEMSAGIAHELRNPMAVISGYLKLLAKRPEAADPTLIRSIQAEIDGMNRIIGDLLTFARPAALNRVPVKVRDLLAGCVASVLQATGALPGIRTELRVDETTISADEGLLKQAFCNLIQNAVEAMPEGGTVTLAGHAAGRDLVITVGDTGRGIPPDALKKIFLPFFTTKDKGTGLGLALVHKIIMSHGGRIEARSAEGQGTTFTVTLPKGYENG